jgi:putative hydrolase of the HAD superfamily
MQRSTYGGLDMIRCVISDLGKVLIFFDNSIFYRRMAAISRLDVEEIASRVNVHSEISQAFDTGRLSPGEFYRKAREVLEVEMSEPDFFAAYNDVFSLNPPVVDALNRLRPRLSRMVMLSNTDVARFGFISDRFPEVHLFDDYVLSYEVGYVKPDPRIYELALDRAGIPPDECVFIDDRSENIEAARGLGIETIHFLEGTDLPSAIERLGILP